MNDYKRLQHRIDKVVGKLGIDDTITLLDSFIGKTTVSQKETEKVKLLYDFLIRSAITVYDLKKETFYSCKIQEYKDARMSCYHLLRKYTDNSYSKIAQRFNLKERNVMYFYWKAEDIFSVPSYYQNYIDKYKILEKHFVGFMRKLN